MRIMSDYKDYYDHAGAMLTERDRVWSRNKHTGSVFIPWDKNLTAGSESCTSTSKPLSRRIQTRYATVIIAGKLYQCYAIDLYDGKDVTSYAGSDPHEVRAAFGVENDIKDFQLLCRDQAIYEQSQMHAARRRHPPHENPGKYVDWDDVHRRLRSPIAVTIPGRSWKEIQVVANPVLKDWGIQKILEPFELFQELSMYLNGPLMEIRNPPVEVSDADKAAKKGFCIKWGFRKRPKEKK